MKLKLIIVLGILFLVSQVNAQENLVLKSQKDRVSYIIGMEIGSNLKKQAIDIDSNILARGVKDILSGAKPLLTEQEVQEIMIAFQKEMMAKQSEVAKKNKAEGETFLAENKKKEGVKALSSGLQYKVIKAGTGRNLNLTIP